MSDMQHSRAIWYRNAYIRDDASVVGTSVSLVTAVAMLRSTLSAQRIAAARLIALLLQQAPSQLCSDGTIDQRPVLLGGMAVPDATWHDVWTCLVHDLDVATPLCAALEDTARPHVAAAAMTAMAALLDGVAEYKTVPRGGLCFPASVLSRSQAGMQWEEDAGAASMPALTRRVAGRAVDVLQDGHLAALHAPALHMLARLVMR